MFSSYMKARIVSFSYLFFFDKLPNGQHDRPAAKGLKLRPRYAIHFFSQMDKVDITGNGASAGMNLQDLQTALLIRQRELQDQVESARTQKGGVNHVRPIGRSKNPYPF